MGSTVNYNDGSQNGRSSSGMNIVLVILGIVFGILLLVVVTCGFFGYMAFRTVNTFTAEIQETLLQSMANDVVQKYQDHELVQKHVGEISDYSFQDVRGFEAMNRPILRMRVTGDKAEGTIVLYRRNNRLQRVMLEIDGQELLLDDQPTELFNSNYDWDEDANVYDKADATGTASTHEMDDDTDQ